MRLDSGGFGVSVDLLPLAVRQVAVVMTLVIRPTKVSTTAIFIHVLGRDKVAAEGHLED